MSIPVTELRPGVTIELEGPLFSVVEYNHIKMGRGGAIVRVKLKNLESGNTIERTFKSNDKVEGAHIDRRQMQFVYLFQGQYYFMDQSTFEQISIPKEKMGDSFNYIREGDVIQVNFHNEKIIGVELPLSVKLKVTETGSAFKGNSVSNIMKPATLETSLVCQVPAFISVGDIIVIDTRTGEYIERA